MDPAARGGKPGLTDSAYVLDNARQEAAARFTALADAFDPGTIRHLLDRGVGPGWRCLEVGGGGGSIATWLAQRVGPLGRVLVTDIDPRYLEALSLPNLEVRRHNIVTDPLPEAAFDLVHARLVLMHLPERESVLTRLVAALKPGGWLVDEEFDSATVSPEPSARPGEHASRTHIGLRRVMADRGVDLYFGRRLFGLLRAKGLANVGAEGRAFMWASGADSLLLRANYEQLSEAMIAAGYVTAEEFRQDIVHLDDPDFMMPSMLLWAAWGQRP
jgi:SAM-dependent methyltransferase